jgi:Cu(I)/Ag(I) efflux system membrane fusion protein
MKRSLTLFLLAGTALLVGFILGRLGSDGGAESPAVGLDRGEEREILYWVAPMDPSFRRDAPGKSPMGMDLVPVYADTVNGQPGVVAIDPAVVSNLGVRTSPAEFGPLPRRIETVGYIGYDEDTLAHVHTRVDGWIENLVTTTAGDPVEHGQLLFEFFSPTLVNAQQEYLAARRSGNPTLLSASRDRLLSLGVSDSEIDRLDTERQVSERVKVFAEKDGVVAMLGVREGIYVTPATDIMSIAELDTVWVTAEVFERQSAWAEQGQHAMVAVDYLPGRMWHGEVDYVYPELDADTRTLKVRLRFDNESRELRPNMFARVTILGEQTGEVVHVPREALIRGGAVDRVVIDMGGGRFRAQPVRVGIESGDRVAILEGVSASDRVVVSGQFLIDSESNIESALSRLGGAAEASDTPSMDHSKMDHDAMDHDSMDSGAGLEESADHSGMDHSQHSTDPRP